MPFTIHGIPVPTSPPVTSQVGLALQDTAELFGSYFGGDIAGKCTCDEADTIARLLLVSGFAEEAVRWLAYHAEEDTDPEDIHAIFWEWSPDGETETWNTDTAKERAWWYAAGLLAES